MQPTAPPKTARGSEGMAAIAYWIACMGFHEGGWSFWHSLFWPYYLAKATARRADREGGA